MVSDNLSNALITLKNSERGGYRNCEIKASKLIGNVLRVLKDYGYIKGFEYVDSKTGSTYRIELSGRINDCGAVRPRYSAKKIDFEKFEKRYLPARDFGILVLSTVDGVMPQNEAVEKGLSGVLLAYIY